MIRHGEKKIWIRTVDSAKAEIVEKAAREGDTDTVLKETPALIADYRSLGGALNKNI